MSDGRHFDVQSRQADGATISQPSGYRRPRGRTREQPCRQARQKGIAERSKVSKAELERAVTAHRAAAGCAAGA